MQKLNFSVIVTPVSAADTETEILVACGKPERLRCMEILLLHIVGNIKILRFSARETKSFKTNQLRCVEMIFNIFLVQKGNVNILVRIRMPI